MTLEGDHERERQRDDLRQTKCQQRGPERTRLPFPDAGSKQQAQRQDLAVALDLEVDRF